MQGDSIRITGSDGRVETTERLNHRGTETQRFNKTSVMDGASEVSVSYVGRL